MGKTRVLVIEDEPKVAASVKTWLEENGFAVELAPDGAVGQYLALHNPYDLILLNCANNQPVPGATGNTFTPVQTGNYAVVVTQNGCTATSTCVFIQIVSTKEAIASSDWSIQPNLASQITRLVFESPLAEELWMEIHDLSGRTLYQKQLPAGSEAADIQLSELPAGVMIVRLSNQGAVSVKRLVKAVE